MTVRREVLQGRLRQGVDEKIAYKITTTPWGTSPGTVTVKAYDVSTPGTRTDVTSTVLSGSAAANGDVITCPVLQALTVDKLYRIEVSFVCSGNTFEAYFEVMAEY